MSKMHNFSNKFSKIAP